MIIKKLIDDIESTLNITITKYYIYSIYFTLKKPITISFFTKNCGYEIINKHKCLDFKNNIILEILVKTVEDCDYIINHLSKSNKFFLDQCIYYDYINEYIIYFYIVDSLSNLDI